LHGFPPTETNFPPPTLNWTTAAADQLWDYCAKAPMVTVEVIESHDDDTSSTTSSTSSVTRTSQIRLTIHVDGEEICVNDLMKQHLDLFDEAEGGDKDPQSSPDLDASLESVISEADGVGDSQSTSAPTSTIVAQSLSISGLIHMNKIQFCVI
jgi:hypothetical protein